MASVVMKACIVHMLGAIMPDPFAMPAMVILPAFTAISLTRVSVVRIALAAALPPCLESFLAAFLIVLPNLVWQAQHQWVALRFTLSIHARDIRIGRTGLVICLAVNIIINIAVVLGLIPTTGIALPFLSYGGSSLVISSAAVGLLLNLSRGKMKAVL